MSENKKFYVTTPIYYVTAHPHLGTLYSTLIADVVARWNKLQGKKTFFLTGTDEHGQKIAQAAAAAGKDPKEFVDSFVPFYQDAWKAYGIEYDYFVRTTDPDHIKGVQQFITKLIEKGDIYKSQYEGWYCTPCERFVTAKEIENETEKEDVLCPGCGRATHHVSEETYFFKLSAYQDKLLAFYKDNPDFIVPHERCNEVTSFVESGLKDLSLSRTTVKWGIPFPNDPKHVVYVWADALSNYITAIGYGNPAKEEKFNFWWPADLHIIGKDIVRFHAVYWPAFLMAAELPLPKQLLVHGWIKVDQAKMSKSLGNVVDPIVLQKLYGAEPVRYYLMRQLPINQDGQFSIEDLEQRIASDLANDLGNLLHRMVSLAEKNNLLNVLAPKVWSQVSLDLRDEAWNTIEDFQSYMNDSMFHLALARLWKFINKVNAYFHENEPWKLAKQDPAQFMQVLSATCHSLRIIAVLAWPVMPKKMSELLSSLGIVFEPANNTLEQLELGSWHQAFVLKKVPTLFEKPEEKIMPNAQADTAQKKSEELKKGAAEDTYIAIDDVAKVELCVGTITACEPVPKSDKLLQMQVDFGQLGMRQILAGVRKFYSPNDLIGKQGIFVCNLKPRKMLGLDSQGMMLVAKDQDGNLQIATVENPVPNGTRLQ